MLPQGNTGFYDRSLFRPFYRGLAVAHPMVVAFVATPGHSGGFCGRQLMASTPASQK